MKDFEFLAVVEVAKSKRVLCQAENCGHSVYKRIHIIKHDGDIGVYGSECAKKLFGMQLNNSSPSCTSSSGVSLSDLDAEQLAINTKKLLEKLRLEYSNALPVEPPFIHPKPKVIAPEPTEITPTKPVAPFIVDANISPEERNRQHIQQLVELSRSPNPKTRASALRDLKSLRILKK